MTPQADRIEINPDVMLGKPVIRGTRVTVELILRKLGEGSTELDLLDAYPHLSTEDIRAAIRYAADVVAGSQASSGRRGAKNAAGEMWKKSANPSMCLACSSRLPERTSDTMDSVPNTGTRSF